MFFGGSCDVPRRSDLHSSVPNCEGPSVEKHHTGEVGAKALLKKWPVFFLDLLARARPSVAGHFRRARSSAR
jgi:hypothetical protein